IFYTLSLHDALPIWIRGNDLRPHWYFPGCQSRAGRAFRSPSSYNRAVAPVGTWPRPLRYSILSVFYILFASAAAEAAGAAPAARSEEHTSELQSLAY